MEIKFKTPMKDEDTRNINHLLQMRKVTVNMDDVSKVLGITLEEAQTKYGKDGDRFPWQDYEVAVKFNKTPEGVPGLWCPINITKNDAFEIEYDDENRVYEYAHWLKWFIEKILIPKGYAVEDYEEFIHNINEVESSYNLVIKDNKVAAYDLILTFSKKNSIE